MPDRLDVVVFVEFVEHLFERFQLVLRKRDLILRDHGKLRFEERQPLLLKKLARLGERGNGRVNFKRVLLRDNVVRACLDGVGGIINSTISFNNINHIFTCFFVILNSKYNAIKLLFIDELHRKICKNHYVAFANLKKKFYFALKAHVLFF